MKSPAEIASFLKSRVPVFAGFTEKLLGQLVDRARVASFEPNEAIVHCGAEATHFGVVLEGTVGASVAADGGARQALGRLEPGDTFGELALMTGDKMPADLVAESHCEVLLIPVPLFQSVIAAEPMAVRNMSRTIAARARAAARPPDHHR